MKYFLFFITLLFSMTACQPSEEFASLGAELKVPRLNQASEYEQELKNAVRQESKDAKIGGKKRETLNLADTVGEKDLCECEDKENTRDVAQAETTEKPPAKRKKKTVITKIRITNLIVEDEIEEAPVKVAEPQVEEQVEEQPQTKISIKPVEEEPSPSLAFQQPEKEVQTPKKEVVEKAPVVALGDQAEVETEVVSDGDGADSLASTKVNILFYMRGRNSQCVQELNRHYTQSGFLSKLDNLDWQVSFSYYSKGHETSILPLQSGFGKPVPTKWLSLKPKYDYTLSRGEYSERKSKYFLHNTLKVMLDNGRQQQNNVPNKGKHLDDPLSGLEYILNENPKNVLREDAFTIVLFMDYDFPYYSAARWKQFFTEHTDVSIIAIGKRSSNVSNLYHALDKGYDFGYLPVCKEDGLVEAIQSKAE